MDASQVNEVVDKLVEKVGPIGAQMIEEFQRMSIAQAVICGALALLLGLGIWLAARSLCRSESWRVALADDEVGPWVAVVFGGLFAVIGAVFAGAFCIQGIVRAYAPTYYCLQALMG